MGRITQGERKRKQEAQNREKAVQYATKHGNKSEAARLYLVSLSSIKRWCKRYDGTWESLVERSHRPRHHPRQHTSWEKRKIRKAFKAKYERYGWQGVYEELLDNYRYKRSFEGMVHAAKRMGLGAGKQRKRPSVGARRYPELTIPGEKVQIDVKVVPYCCLRGDALEYNKRFYQWTAIDECTRERFVYGYEEQTQENSVDFLRRAVKYFKFRIQTVQTDNGSEFTYRFLRTEKECPFDEELRRQGIKHKLIAPRTPWHNGKVERSHRSDQRYFYDWEVFKAIEEFNA
ncbi:MAG: DDE-type integrase/transposase/recombinase, partial [Oscillospiraceae bacterium]|nr:DDE-type integrase/transposase/recombinase [Oscillospiraceae bacterium]